QRAITDLSAGAAGARGDVAGALAGTAGDCGAVVRNSVPDGTRRRAAGAVSPLSCAGDTVCVLGCRGGAAGVRPTRFARRKTARGGSRPPAGPARGVGGFFGMGGSVCILQCAGVWGVLRVQSIESRILGSRVAGVLADALCSRPSSRAVSTGAGSDSPR